LIASDRMGRDDAHVSIDAGRMAAHNAIIDLIDCDARIALQSTTNDYSSFRPSSFVLPLSSP